jgi:hypothetical protein
VAAAIFNKFLDLHFLAERLSHAPTFSLIGSEKIRDRGTADHARRDRNWSLTSLRQRLVKTGGRLVKHPALLAAAGGGHLTRTQFAAMLRRIALLPLPAS